MTDRQEPRNGGRVTPGRMNSVHQFNPVEDPRWESLVARHPHASVFHSSSWLEALRRTYGYEPVALTTSEPGQELANGLVLFKMRSWLTGRRMVSLPFSDHCQPLVESGQALQQIVRSLDHELQADRITHIELRPIVLPEGSGDFMRPAQTFCFHLLDLQPSTPTLFGALHKSCVQRKIRRAEREALECTEGVSETVLRQFYELLVATRRRHRLPAQPLAWFRNLIACLGDGLTIRVAAKDGRPVASILTLSHKTTLVYKYGCSDKRFANMGGIQLLLWKAIETAKREGLCQFDLGRSDWQNRGLIDFKDRWGAARSTLTYMQYSTRGSGRVRPHFAHSVVRRVAAHVPQSLVFAAGRALYRHLG